MSMGLLYLLLVVLPNIKGAADGLITVGLMGLFMIPFIVFLGSIDSDLADKTKGNLWTAWRWAVGLGFLGLLLNIFAPEERQIYMVAGGYAATNDAELKKLPDNVLGAANAYLQNLQKKLEDVKPRESADGRQPTKDAKGL